MPIAWVSIMAMNSPLSGSGASAATTLIDSNSGSPALMPRTMTSTASGSALRNFFSRRFLRKPRIQRGRPKPAAKPRPRAPSNPRLSRNATAKNTTPRMPEMIMNFRGVHSSPAWVRRTLSETFFSFCRRASTSFSEPSTCSRRERCALSVWRTTGSDLATDARRASAFFSPDSSGYRNTHASPPMAVAARKPNASVCVFMGPIPLDLHNDLGGVDRRCEPLFLAVIACAFPEPRPAYSGRAVAADNVAVGVLADHVVQHDVLGDDGVAFHPHHFGDVRDAA